MFERGGTEAKQGSSDVNTPAKLLKGREVSTRLQQNYAASHIAWRDDAVYFQGFGDSDFLSESASHNEQGPRVVLHRVKGGAYVVKEMNRMCVRSQQSSNRGVGQSH